MVAALPGRTRNQVRDSNTFKGGTLTLEEATHRHAKYWIHANPKANGTLYVTELRMGRRSACLAVVNALCAARKEPDHAK